MTSPTRLRDGDATDVERALLDSSLDDMPSAAARKRTLVALGLSVGAATALAPSAVHAAAQAAGGASGKTAGTITALAIAKWLGTGAAIGAVTAACIATVTTPGFPFRETKAPVATTPKTVNGIHEPPAHAAAARAAPEETPAAEVPAAPEPPSHVLSGSSRGAAMPGEPLPEETQENSVPSTRNTNVMAEVASLDRARGALAQGDAQGAMARLTEHARKFPGGALEPEAVLLRVRALRDLGQYGEATRLARGFLAAHPESPQAPRLRALVGTPPN